MTNNEGRYEVTRAAVEVQRRDEGPDAREGVREARIIRSLRSRWRRVGVSTMIVSFVHMVGTLVLFSGASAWERGAALLLVWQIDYSAYSAAQYLVYVPTLGKRLRGGARHWLTLAVLLLALTLTCLLNASYMWQHRPAALDWRMALGIVIALSALLPLNIIASGVAESELDADLHAAREIAAQRAAKAALEAAKVAVVAPAPATQTSVLPALAQHNEGETLDMPQRHGNGKAVIMTTDVDAMLAVLREAGVARLSSAAELGRLCGWSSSSSASKAMAALREAGALANDGATLIFAKDNEA